MQIFAQKERRETFRREALPHIDSLYRIAVRSCADPALVQEIFTEAWRTMNRVPARATGRITALQDVLKQELPDYHFVGVMECGIEEAVFTHYILRGGSGILSFIVERQGDNETLPGRGWALSLSDLTLRSVNEGPVAVASMDAAGYLVNVIGDGFSKQHTVSLTESVAPGLQEALLQAG